jgi:hypothetical protein
VGSSQAVARLTPEDDLPVAIFLQIRVKCGRQLELQLSYEAQLGPEFARLPVSRRGINATWEASQSQLRIGKQALKRIDQLYDVGDAINRKLNRRMLREKREHLENRVAMLEPYVQRLEMLEILATKLDASGKLHFELFVDWPDESRQPLLRTVGGDDNERRSADAG